MCALAVEVEEIFSAKLHASGIEMRMELECGARPLAFSGELRQVISNLVSNAIDASSPGGKVWLRLRPAERNAKPGICISVADRGPGIPRPYYPELFQPFSSRKQTGGTGLGLWVAHSIVARHKGSIRLRSCTDAGRSGTVFSVFIPLASTVKVDRSDTIGKLFRELGEGASRASIGSQIMTHRSSPSTLADSGRAESRI